MSIMADQSEKPVEIPKTQETPEKSKDHKESEPCAEVVVDVEENAEINQADVKQATEIMQKVRSLKENVVELLVLIKNRAASAVEWSLNCGNSSQKKEEEKSSENVTIVIQNADKDKVVEALDKIAQDNNAAKIVTE